MSEVLTDIQRKRALPRWLRGNDAIIIGALIVVALVACLTVRNFASTTTLGFLLIQIVPILLIAMPMALVIISGEIDLSVASTAGLTSAVMGVLWRDSGLDIWLVMLLSLVVGVLCGAFNGFLITVLGLPSLAVTIGTLALFRGLALVVIGDNKVSDFPEELTTLATAKIGATGIPIVMIGVLAIVILFGVLLHFTPFGRGLYALGYSPEAATFVGIRVGRAKFWLFVATGVVSALVGVYWTLRFASAGPDNATGIELSVIAAVLLGGVSIFGGKGSIPGVVAGVLLIGVVTYALRLGKVPETTLTIVTGALLVISVLAPSIAARVRERVRLARVHREVQRLSTAGEQGV
ncbi:ABC transporter permease [Cnuibacter sp. UC19_7]|uniref:ABC transporter permease n=1 Tax=Cnuibacter sp. UC19_7 TaxID=3350166 RepID=UPI00366EC6A4